MEFLYTISHLFTLFSIYNFGFADNDFKNNSSTRKSLHEKFNSEIMLSNICNKCLCDPENSLIDCTKKLREWIPLQEWEIFQSNKIIFEDIKMEHNNFTTVPIFPSYAVKSLYLGHNQISFIAPGAFQNLTELIKLDLSNNKLTSKALQPNVFKGTFSIHDFEPLQNLKFLNLGYNLLHSLNDDLFEHLPNLEELILCSNIFQVIDHLSETALSGLSSLKTLDISYMELRTLPDTILHGPRELETLIASGNLFTELPKGLSYAQNLRRLVLDENPLLSLQGDNIFPSMSYLSYLSISYMPRLSKIGSAAFRELQNLTELILSDNKMLTEIDELAFAKNITGGNILDYPPLEKLHLNNCNLTMIPKNLIIRWDKITVLDLRYNPWKCDMSNEYMIKYLIPRVYNRTPILASNIKCSIPQELKDVEVLTIVNEDLQNNTQKRSLVWIGFLVIFLVIIPLAIVGIVIYRRGFCLFGKRIEAGKRTLYSRASFNEDFHI